MRIELDFIVPWWGFVLLGVYVFWRLYEETWKHFLAIFHIKKVEEGLRAEGHQLGAISRFMGYWVLLPKGLLYDWLLNIVMSLPLLDPPRQWWWLRVWRVSIPVLPLELVTGRLQRYVDGPDGWRRRFALALDADKLEPYDPGHIKKTIGGTSA
jgi:hypothetical protein